MLCFLFPTTKTQRIAAAAAKSVFSSDSPLKKHPFFAGMPAALLAKYQSLEPAEGMAAPPCTRTVAHAHAHIKIGK